MKLPNPRVETQYIKFDGGIDLATAVLSIDPGAALSAFNYELGSKGGYRRIDGYERYDGRTSPSSATYVYLPFVPSNPPTVGQLIHGVTSGAFGKVALIGSGYLILTMVTGTFVNGETISTSSGSLPLVIGLNNAATTLGTVADAPGQAPTGYLDAVAKNAAADLYRALIGKPPGSGAARGIVMYAGTVYAFHDSEDGTQGLVFKATPAGWQGVPLGYEMDFTSGGTYEIAEGDAVMGAVSNATAIVRRVVLEGGSFAGGTARGRLIFWSVSGAFQAGEALVVGANMDVATVTANASAITLLPGGRYEFDINNLGGATGTRRIYGCDRKNRGFEFDGVTYVPIRTGMANDAPIFVRVHAKQLFFAFPGGSSQNSGVGTPYVWTAVAGAAELGIGDEVTGYLSVTGKVLLIYARNSTHQLIGSTVNDFDLQVAAPEVGAIPYTVQNVIQQYSLDDKGVVQFARSQIYGNFSFNTVSERIQKIIDDNRSKVIASAVYRKRDQYRIYFSDGGGITMTVVGNKVRGFTRFQYPVNVTCTWTGEDATGADVVFFGDDQGYVYQADRGSSFDGAEIEAYLVLPFNNLKSPRQKKRFRLAVQEMIAVGYCAIRFNPIFSYGNQRIATHRLDTEVVQGGGGFWDVANWDEFYWDAALVATPQFKIKGSGTNVALVYYSKSDIDLGHTLQGVILHYSDRALAR